LLLVHLLSRPEVDTGHGVSATCGFVVSKAVGGSVVRHRVLRRLRHLMTERLVLLPAGSQLVVRAFPPAATASSAALGAALDRSLRGVLDRPVIHASAVVRLAAVDRPERSRRA
jgi:ribonuclease P protein component